MRISNHHKIILFTLTQLALITSLSGQHFSSRDMRQISEFTKALSEQHVAFEKITPAVSKRLPQTLFMQFDREKKYLTDGDFNRLRQNLDLIAIPSYDKAITVLDSAYTIVTQRLQKTITFLRTIPTVDFFIRDSVLLNPSDSLPDLVPDGKINDRWIQYLKLEVLYRYHSDSSIMALDKVDLNKALNEKLQELAGNERCKVETLELAPTALHDFILNNFLRSIAKCYDPHSDFFSASGESFFTRSLSSEMNSTGIIFNDDNGRFIIEAIVPMSSASQEEIETGDEIIAILEGKEWTPMACVTTETLEQYFYGSTIPAIDLEIKSETNHQVRNFHLIKKPVNNEDNHTFSYLLEKNSNKIGYTNFPAFYSAFTPNGRSSGQDIALTLLHIKNKVSQGLIIDLRNNGGGSLEEALDLAGFFIDYGPLFVSVDRKNGPYVQKDTKRGQVFNGKVIFLVNAQSASASEMLVSALRNYPNILVVGSETFGKSTGQTLIPLTLNNEQNPFGLASITTLRIYELNGTSYQGKGITPDIILPSIISKKIAGEGNYSYTLKNLPISKSYIPPKIRSEPIAELSRRSAERISMNPEFKKIKSIQKKLDALLSVPWYQSLNFSDFKDISKDLMPVDFSDDDVYFELTSLEDNDAFLTMSEDQMELTRHDPVIKEAFRIMEDWITITK